MAFRHRGGSRIATRAPKRMTSWLDLAPIATSLTATGGSILFVLDTAEKARRPFTIVRTRLLVSIITDQVAASETQVGAIGMCVVSDQAVAAGVGSIPTPITDIASDFWFVHQLLYNDFVFATGIGFQDGGSKQYEVDSKAMRKVNDAEDVVVVGEFSSAGSGGFDLTIGGRVLIKEH